MTVRKVFGIVKFAEAVFCAADSLGQTVNISLAKHTGTLTLPSLPEWDKKERDPLHSPLLGPSPARTWKRGESLINWGRPTSYPTGTSEVELALLEFSLAPEEADVRTQEIYAAFPLWLRLFEQYVTLLTTQYTRNQVSGGDGPGWLELLFEEDSGLKHISRSTSTLITIETGGADESLHLKQLREAAQLASRGLHPRLQYRMLLEAYSAQRNEDYRKAIIEGATALEVCLTARILEEFDTQGISFGEKLLQKFRMLGGRFELIRMLGISLPERDYATLVVNPRNDVVHRAEFPNKALANQVITEVKELLQLFSPQIHENT
jgi:hypothetical protein